MASAGGDGSPKAAPARHTDDFPAIATAMAEAFALPLASVLAIMDPRSAQPGHPVQLWVAREGGEVVGAGASVDAGSNVGVYTMSTPKRHERRGIGRSVLSAIHEHARKRGATDLLLGATEAGFPLYTKVGYETVAEVQIAVAGISTQFPGD